MAPCSAATVYDRPPPRRGQRRLLTPELMEKAMTLRDIAHALGGTLNRGWINVRGPGHSSTDRSLGIKLDPNAPDGFRLHSLAGDDPIQCRQHVKKLLQSIADGSTTENEIEVESASTEDLSCHKLAAAMEVWRGTKPPRDTIVEKYLARRGCQLTATMIQMDSVRFHEACPFGRYRLPAMVALIRDVITAEPRGIHRTALNDDGSSKRPMPNGMSSRMVLGALKGGVIMFGIGSLQLGIAEGIETALSAQQLFRLPVWAAISAAGIAVFPTIHGLNHLTIFGDADIAGRKAAEQCARRYEKAGIEGEIRYPPIVGSDWNDYLMEQMKDGPPDQRKQSPEMSSSSLISLPPSTTRRGSTIVRPIAASRSTTWQMC